VGKQVGGFAYEGWRVWHGTCINRYTTGRASSTVCWVPFFKANVRMYIPSCKSTTIRLKMLSKHRVIEGQELAACLLKALTELLKKQRGPPVER